MLEKSDILRVCKALFSRLPIQYSLQPMCQTFCEPANIPKIVIIKPQESECDRCVDCPSDDTWWDQQLGLEPLETDAPNNKSSEVYNLYP